MLEIEIKASGNLEKVKEKLRQLDAKRIGQKTQKDIYYQAPHRDFKETDEALRIRQENGDIYLTYKGPKIDDETKTRREIEIELKSLEKMDSILEFLGFKKSKTVEKQRQLYSIDEYKIALDDVKGLGEFIEIETITDTKDGYEQKKDEALDILKKLVNSETITKSYMEMLLDDS